MPLEELLVSLVITSCGRLDLLNRTISTLEQYNTHPFNQKIIIDDSGDEDCYEKLCRIYKEYDVICNRPKIGQLESIDRAYGLVSNPWIFHCEDDWEFCRYGFIEESYFILKDNPSLIQVWIRGDSNHKPSRSDEIFVSNRAKYQMMPIHGDWGGFSFNPGLRRLSDYRNLGGYSGFVRELEVSKWYIKNGYRAAKTMRTYCNHIGWNRHIVDPFQR